MFDNLQTGVSFLFSSNSKFAFGEIIKYGTDAGETLTKLEAAFTNAGMAAKRASGSFLAASDAMATGFGNVSRAAGSMDGTVGTALTNIDRQISLTAGRVEASTAAMEAGLSGVAAAAERAALGISGTSAASGRMSRTAGRSGAAGAAAGHGGAITGSEAFGLGSLGFLVDGLKQGGDLQNSAMQTAIAQGRLGANLNATMANMRPTIDTAYRMSAITGGSVNDMMTVQQNMATSGLTNTQISGLAMPMAQLADILHYGKSQMGFGEAGTLAAGLTHDFGVFDATGLKSVFQTLAKAEYASPHRMQELGTQIRQFAPQFAGFLPGTATQNADYIVRTEALADRMGMSQRSGAGLNMLATYLQSPRTDRGRQALFDFGITDSARKGARNRFFDPATRTFNYEGAVESIHANAGKLTGQTYLNDSNAFSQNANRYLQMYMRKNEPEVWKRLNTQMNNEPNIDTLQHQLMDTLPHAFGRLETNVQSLATVFGDKSAALTTKPVGGLADIVGNTTDFFRKNPVATDVGLGVLAFGAIKGVGALFKLLGGVSLFAEHFAHEAKAGLGIRAYMRVPHGIGAASEVAEGASVAARGFSLGRAASGVGGIFDGISNFVVRGIKGAFTMSGLRGMGGAFGEFGRDLTAMGSLTKEVGLRAMISGGGIRMLGGSVLRVGLAALSGIGDILLLQQGIQFLGDHAKDIGGAIGAAAGWIYSHGKPMIVNAFKSLLSEVGSFLFSREAFMAVMGGLQGGIGGIFSNTDKAIDGTLGGIVHGFLASQPGYNPATDKTAWNSTSGFGPSYGEKYQRAKYKHAFDHPFSASPLHAQTGEWGGRAQVGAYGSSQPTHASARTHKLADLGGPTRAIQIGEFTVYAAHGDDLSDLINYVEKHADKDHGGAATPTQPAVRSGATPGTSHAGIG